MSSVFLRSFLLFGLLALAHPAAAQTGVKACTCNNLESLQQDYQNAVYLEGFFRKLSTELQGYEGRDLAKGVSRDEVDAFAFKFYGDVKRIAMKLPFPAIKGYEGPESIEMPWGTCEQDWVLLDLMKDRSPCKAMADFALQHEEEHRNICNTMGPSVYWGRKASEMAAEEADRYKAQSARLLGEIRRVLDASNVQLRGEWLHTLSGEGAVIEYFYTFDSGKMKTTSEGDGFWNLTGKGTTSNQILSMTAPGVACTSTGAYKNEMKVTMATNGLTFGLELSETSKGGDLVLTCNGFSASSMNAPAGDASSGQLAAGLPLKAGETMIGNAWADQIMALAASQGMSVTGDPTTSLTITCEAP